MLSLSNLRYLLMFILLVLIQVVVLNSVSFFSYAIPLIYIYFILKLPIGINQNLLLILAFLLGFTIDIFCNTLGINAAATTFVALVRRPVMGMFFMQSEHVGDEPSIGTLGLSIFMKYAVIIVFIHMLALVSLEAFSYFNIQMIILKILLSTLISSILIFGLEGFGMTKKTSSWRKI